MAQIVLGIGSSHSPLLTIAGPEWEHRARADRNSPTLYLSDGRVVSYAQLSAEVGDRYQDIATEENFIAIEGRCQKALDRLADDLEQAAPDVVVVIGDDQGELFERRNMPCISVFHGEEVVTSDHWVSGDNVPEWRVRMSQGYAMNEIHRFPAAPEQGRQLIDGLISRYIDVSAADNIVDPRVSGFGHAFGFIAQRLYKKRAIPMLPLLLNTYYPPNVMRPERAFAIGQAIREVIETSWAPDLRVAIVASGGLSHFVTDVELDRRVLEGMEKGKHDLLLDIPPHALRDGSSEILNWIMLAGCVSGFARHWNEYHPVFRTPAGTGCGLAFSAWLPNA